LTFALPTLHFCSFAFLHFCTSDFCTWPLDPSTPRPLLFCYPEPVEGLVVLTRPLEPLNPRILLQLLRKLNFPFIRFSHSYRILTIEIGFKGSKDSRIQVQKLEVNRAKVQNQTENAGKLRICHPPARPGDPCF